MTYNVLIVDDSALMRKVLERTISMCDVEINEVLAVALRQAIARGGADSVMPLDQITQGIMSKL